MPVWWDKLSGRTKDSEANCLEGSSPKNEKKRGKGKRDCEVKSFEEILVLPQSRNSPRNSRDFSAVGRCSGFSGFDSASSLDRAHPLPLPLEPPSDQPGPVGFVSGSGSVSSLSSSGSYDDPAHVLDQNGFRGHVENRVLSPLSRSPGRGSRCISTGTSPIHSRTNVNNLDCSNGKLEDGRNEWHKLPRPPGSIVSPSPSYSPRSPGTPESSGGISSKWRKGKLLGRGTFGHVYLGFNSENGQMCAIKEVRVVSDDPSSKESLKQLNQEIALLSRLSHPNIVQYYGSDLSEDRLSVYLEYVSGGSIYKLLQEYGAFAEPVIQNYTRQILSGLAYLHGRNTIHRDIKGANILVDPNGEIKVADFGMAKHVWIVSSSMLSFKGSPYWMAPEVVMNTNGYSLPVDIWSLGCTVLEMATSKPPWSQYEGVAAIFKIGNSKDVPEIPDHLSADAKSFIRQCLQREPSARPTASQLLGHPFVRNQSTPKATNVNITREAFPRAFDGSRTPTALDMQSSRMNNLDQDDASRLVGVRTFTCPRDNVRAIASSLPVSPPSSPLRRDATAHKNFFLSPPHPSYAVVKSTLTHTNNLVHPFRPNTRSTFDPWHEIPLFRGEAPVKSSSRTLL
ncbi:Mitogen-activated protein kinase kinase kinase 3 [Dorcoceras hygrometricum]|uniref:mitogen-activated protein kinase kinase kinase n=1 Tax=Dorcoceras hygrometricum TaxID=472368 RepID=A0A2Z7D5Q2_9LAMI|nr:Mitogen-activated protein kinase kinase kinase 3 [Dorcoceras hygrometricum]